MYEQFWHSLINHKKVCILLGNRFDFDSFGSGFALMALLKTNHVEVDIYYADIIPTIVYDFFTNDEISQIKIQVDFDKIDFTNYQAIVFNDVSQLQMVGKLGELFVLPQNIETYNIDHHITNTKYANHNLVVPCISTCRVVYDLIAKLNLTLTPRIAFYLLIGHLTDSGFLKFNGVEPYDIKITFDLVDISGVAIFNIANKFDKLDLPTLKFQGYILGRITEKADYIYVEYDDKEVETYIGTSLENITYPASDIIKRVKNKKFVYTLHQKIELSKNGLPLFSVSFRSCDDDFDVSSLAQKLGGGGHKMAASAKFEAKGWNQAREMVRNLFI